MTTMKKSEVDEIDDVEPPADSAPEPEAGLEEGSDAHATGAIPVGATGPTVLKLQGAVGAPLTGVFDRVTVNAVRAAQRARGAAQTGNVDIATRRMLKI